MTSVPLGLPARRMHHHAGRLVDDDDVAIVEEDVEREVFGAGALAASASGSSTAITSPSRISELALRRLDPRVRDVAGFDQPLDLRPRMVGDFAGQKPIEAVAFVVGVGGEVQAVTVSQARRSSRVEAKFTLTLFRFQSRQAKRGLRGPRGPFGRRFGPLGPAQVPQHEQAERREHHRDEPARSRARRTPGRDRRRGRTR